MLLGYMVIAFLFLVKIYYIPDGKLPTVLPPVFCPNHQGTGTYLAWQRDEERKEITIDILSCPGYKMNIYQGRESLMYEKKDLHSLLQKSGFRGEGLRMAYAIARAESGGRAEALNVNVQTGDQSYGIFQVNMKGYLGTARRKRYGLIKNEDLLDPFVNAKVAYALSHGGKDWGMWGSYGNGSYKQYLADAQM